MLGFILKLSTSPIKCDVITFLKGSGQFPSPPDCSLPSAACFPAGLTAPGSVVSTHWIAETQWNSLTPQTIDSDNSHKGLHSDCPPCTWEQPALYLTHVPIHILKPWGTCREEPKTHPAPIPSQTLHFKKKNSFLTPPPGLQSGTQPPITAASKRHLDQIIWLLPPLPLEHF